LRNKFQFRYEDIAEGRKDITLYENNIEKSIIEALIQKSPQSFKNHVEKLVGRYNQGKHNFTVLLTYCKKENFLNEWGKYQEWHSDLIKENKKHHKLKIIDNKSLKADQNFKFAYSDYKIDNGRITRIYHIFVDFTII
ncbi:MAG: hypothetical protein U9Q83_06595, partial [Bacteroidota bacterium]|nr:hypothetical protein [Bacteroidota bacterium]